MLSSHPRHTPLLPTFPRLYPLFAPSTLYIWSRGSASRLTWGTPFRSLLFTLLYPLFALSTLHIME